MARALKEVINKCLIQKWLTKFHLSLHNVILNKNIINFAKITNTLHKMGSQEKRKTKPSRSTSSCASDKWQIKFKWEKTEMQSNVKLEIKW